MSRKQTRCNERSARASALPGTVLALVAFVGIDHSLAGQHLAGRWHKGASVTIRAALPATGAALSTISAGLTLAAGGLVLLLLLSRKTPTLARSVSIEASGHSFLCSSPPGLIFRRTSISYHTGGLYGP